MFMHASFRTMSESRPTLIAFMCFILLAPIIRTAARFNAAGYRELEALPLKYVDIEESYVTDLKLPNQRKGGSSYTIRFTDPCTSKDISISQSREDTSGMPQYIVQIVNTCLSDCAPSDIHVFCGWFASAPLVNPNIFRRVAYNDCLVNGGKPLKQGDIVRFEYSNSFMYSLNFRSARFC
ncbi:hypothetical protein O6H91_07G109500 [Diphasiastrum complanatum]|uniref:Uncharacterized protein n=1 Tax=Diphasiastrum complanatum TaxID=34168 RepID=A0ACC2D8M0_DIPCM|nr:hypothetical protein O6H91_07G109500 [Diphasiastrum complanatum]